MSTTALGEVSPGKVVNLIANDVNRFEFVSIFVHYMWAGPLATLVVGYFLYYEVGYAGLVSIAAIFIVIPIQGNYLLLAYFAYLACYNAIRYNKAL